jgi:hypothetical protein
MIVSCFKNTDIFSATDVSFQFLGTAYQGRNGRINWRWSVGRLQLDSRSMVGFRITNVES